MARITALSAPGSRLAQQYTSPAAMAAGTSTAVRARIARVPGAGRFIPGGQTHLGPDAESFLSGLGWNLEYRQGSADFARIGRPLPPEEVTDLLVGTRAAAASG